MIWLHRPITHRKTPSHVGKGYILLYERSILALAGRLSLLLTLHAGLLLMLTLTDFLDDAGAGALTLEALQGALQGFVLTTTYLGHCYPSFRSSRLDISQIDRRMAKTVQIF